MSQQEAAAERGEKPALATTGLLQFDDTRRRPVGTAVHRARAGRRSCRPRSHH